MENEYDLSWTYYRRRLLDICRNTGETLAPPVLMLARDSRRTRQRPRLGVTTTKPFSFDVLLARVRALSRVRLQNGDTEMTDLEMDPARRRVTRDGAEVQLTGKEYALLEYLMRNQGVVLSEARIIEHVWDMNHDSMTNTVNVYIHHLRNKIDRGRSRRLIHTIRGAGFMLSERETDPA